MNTSDAERYEEVIVRAVNDLSGSIEHLDRYDISLVLAVRWEFAMLMLRLAVKLDSPAT